LQENNKTTITQLFEGFRSTLISDLDEASFADLFAQTLAYGMFTARYYDTTQETFSRQEAINTIPKSNPLLRKLFKFVSDQDLDQRFDWVIEDLVDIFLHSNIRELLANFGQATAQHDPILHFYETFLAEYDPKLRQSRGVYYTPEPVVNFIVRSVDEILKTDFGLPMGLADTSKIKQEVDLDTTLTTKGNFVKTGTGNTAKYYQDVHRVQILDPATGTGTFLYETFKHIQSKFAGQAGLWPSYVTNDLIPRLFGFELMITSYTMAHLKLAMAMIDSGVEMTGKERINVYLTNSLEEAPKVVPDLFGAAEISEEGRVAGRIKTQNKIMVVMGNPPYSVSSSNSGEWIQNLIKDYKKDLGERKINLDDDYIKFIRYGQHFVEKNGEGILAYISNNSFIDGVTHRRMRQSLMETFDKVYILDLHGNAKKKEVALDGSKMKMSLIFNRVLVSIFL
jgi:predicted helicase